MKVLDPILWSNHNYSTPLQPTHRRHTFTTAAAVCLGCGLSLNITCETCNLHWALRVTLNTHGSGASETYLFALYETSYVLMSFQYLEGSFRDHVYLWGIQYIARKIQYMCLFNAPDGSWISVGYSISSWRDSICILVAPTITDVYICEAINIYLGGFNIQSFGSTQQFMF